MTEKMKEKCRQCYTCERGISSDVTREMYRSGPREKSGKSPESSITYFIFPTNQCNLRCSYCYATKVPAKMDERLFHDTASFIVKNEKGKGRRVHIQFFGGEPTLLWEDLVKFVTEIQYLFSEQGMVPRFGMTTNGTLLDEARLVWLKQQQFHLLFSIDGRKKTHNKHRKYVNGKGSFDDIPLDLIAKYFPNNEIRPTILPDTVKDWYDDLMFFHSKEFYTVATEVAYEVEWTDKDMENARKMYSQVADLYVRRKSAGLPMWAKFIDDGRNLRKPSVSGPVCGIGKNSLAIDAMGGIFACQRYASFSNPDLKLGTVRDGLDQKKLLVANSLRREFMHPDPKSGFFCQTCPARYRCHGGCNAMNFQCNKDRKIILSNYCRFQRMWTEIGLRVAASLGWFWRGKK